MALPDYLAWCWHGTGAYYLPRLRVGWQIEAAAERKRWADAERKAKRQSAERAGWSGGEADPEDSVAGWDDDGDPSAA